MLRMREDGKTKKVFYECDIAAASWEARPGDALFLTFRAGLWLAMHAPMSACLDDLARTGTQSLVFSSKEDISQPGAHQWLAPP